VAVWFLLARPLAAADLAARSAPPPPRTPIARPTGPTCGPGPPQRVVYPDLGVDAAVERIGLETDAPAGAGAAGTLRLGNPTDISRIGWYADGPRPGSGAGTVLLDGHTYRDGSAVFGEDFPSRAQAGQLVQTVQQDGSVCSYRVDRVWPAVDAQRGYPASSRPSTSTTAADRSVSSSPRAAAGGTRPARTTTTSPSWSLRRSTTDGG